MISLLYADGPMTAATQGSPSPLVSLMPLVVIFVIFYFLLIRPQQKKMKQQKQMLDGLKVGDKVITSSGFYATVVSIGDASVEVKLADNVKVKILKSTVSEILGSQEPAVTAK